MTFREAVCFWLAGYGLTPEQCDKVCDERRVAFSIRTEDHTGILGDLQSALYLVGQPGFEAEQALRSPAEKLLLMAHLEQHHSSGGKHSRAQMPTRSPVVVSQNPAVAVAPVPVVPVDDKLQLFNRICREMELKPSEFRLLRDALKSKVSASVEPPGEPSSAVTSSQVDVVQVEADPVRYHSVSLYFEVTLIDGRCSLFEGTRDLYVKAHQSLAHNSDQRAYSTMVSMSNGHEMALSYVFEHSGDSFEELQAKFKLVNFEGRDCLKFSWGMQTEFPASELPVLRSRCESTLQKYTRTYGLKADYVGASQRRVPGPDVEQALSF